MALTFTWTQPPMTDCVFLCFLVRRNLVRMKTKAKQSMAWCVPMTTVAPSQTSAIPYHAIPYTAEHKHNSTFTDLYHAMPYHTLSSTNTTAENAHDYFRKHYYFLWYGMV